MTFPKKKEHRENWFLVLRRKQHDLLVANLKIKVAEQEKRVK